ncbi:MAG: copper amine oxidase N-terminal domain-containing protein [Candidatus Velthaea sp.]
MKLPQYSAAAAAATLSASLTASAVAQSVGVTLNGSPVTLNPPPQTRAGRVFVPLRGIFEKLGATVVYANGVINAQGNGRAISLKIGSTQATVDGQSQTVDVAPFIIGASTYVPLRFVSQALGATVNYDGANHVVAIATGGAAPVANAPAQTITPAAAPAAGSQLQLRAVRPGRGATVESRRPSVEAQFVDVQADPNSLRITIDGTDVTGQSSRSPVGFVFSPQSDLQSMEHTVRVTGKDTTGAAFDRTWRFTSGTSVVENTITNLAPANGAAVGTQFTVSGHTLPGAQVVVQVGAANNPTSVAGAVGAILGIGGGANARNEVTANADGSFSTVISVNAPPGASLQMVVNSTDPRTKTAARPINRTLTIKS